MPPGVMDESFEAYRRAATTAQAARRRPPYVWERALRPRGSCGAACEGWELRGEMAAEDSSLG